MAPNSRGSPKRPDGVEFISASRTSSYGRPAAFARPSIVTRSRSVANWPGSRLLIVTLCRTTLRASPATKPVSPERAPFDRPSTSIGAFTALDVMLTMRPNLRSIITSTVALMSSIGVSMFASSARIHAARSQSRKSPGGGPPALLTRMSGCGHAASARARPSAVVMSHATQATGRPASCPISSAACATSCSVREQIVTSTPSRASASAQPRPSPLLAAHTSARRPAMPRSIRYPFSSGGLRRAGAAHLHYGADRDDEQRGDREEHLAREPVIEHQPEPHGPEHRTEIESRIDEAVHAARGALRGRVADDQVPRRPRRPDEEADDDEERHDPRQRHDVAGDQREQRGANQQAARRDTIVPRRAHGEETAEHDACRAAEQVRSNGRRRDHERHREPRIQRRWQERLQAHRGRGLKDEIEKAQQDRGLHEQPDAAFQRMQVRIGGAVRREDAALAREDAEHHESGDAHYERCDAPSERRAEAETDDRRESVTEVAAHSVCRIRVAESALRDIGIEDREIRWMEHAVACAHQHRARIKPQRIWRKRRSERAADEQRHAGEQHRPRTEAIDDEARHQLHDAACDVKETGDEAK